MPNTKQAAKRLRQDQKRAERNQRVKLNLNYVLKQVTKAVAAKDKTRAQAWALKFQKAVDKAVALGQLHKNTAARRKSRLLFKVNALQ